VNQETGRPLSAKYCKTSQPTIRDIAQKAQVSPTTVSIALEGKQTSRVSEATQKKILAIAQEMNYRPNYAARALATQVSKTIGVVVPTLINPIYAEFCQDLINRAREKGYSLEVCSCSGEEKPLRQAAEGLLYRGVDGLIICCAHRNCRVVLELQEKGIPLVLSNRSVESPPGRPKIDYYGMDDRLGAYRMLTHLIRMGHTRIGMICGPDQTSTGHNRHQGALEAMAAFGLEVPAELVVTGDFYRDSGIALGKKLMTLKEPPTAIFAANDNMAVGVLITLKKLGLSAPDDVALAGYDDMDVASLPGVELTTVSQKFSSMGRLAMDKLISKMRQQDLDGAEQVLFNPVLVIRQSCGFKAADEKYQVNEPAETTTNG
jgi:DNA-binding LacI/PurR family transcriptional regulator